MFGVGNLDEVDSEGNYSSSGDGISEVIYFILDENGAYTFEKIVGSEVNDTIVNHGDVIFEIFGGSGDDQIYGSFGDETLSGGAGNDVLLEEKVQTFVITEDTFDTEYPFRQNIRFRFSENDQIDLSQLNIEGFSSNNISIQQNSKNSEQFDALISVDTSGLDVRVIVENVGNTDQDVTDLVSSILV